MLYSTAMCFYNAMGIMKNIERHFIWIILFFSGVALIYPTLFVACKPWIPIGLGFIMFGIGVNLPLSAFSTTLAKPKSILGLIVFRFILMPMCAWLIAHILHLNESEIIGLLVLGTAPGGTASNVMAYLSKSNVSLAVILTFGTTLLSPLLTPAIIYLLLHKQVTIAFWPIASHIASIVMVPIVAGLLLNYLKLNWIEKIRSFFPSVSIILVAMIIACLFALNRQTLLTFPGMAIFAALSLNMVGFLMGKIVATIFKQNSSNTISTIFDYGMFDAIVAIVICTTFFGQETALPAVLISIIQNLTAPIIVYYQSGIKGRLTEKYI